MKTCRSCGTAKPREEFYADKRNKDGLRGSCKECSLKQNKKWSDANKDKQEAYIKEYRAANRDKVRQWSADYRERNREAVREQGRLKESRRRAAIREAEGEMPNGSWTALLEFYGQQCMNPDCKTPDESLTLDHVVAIALGGMHDLSNAQVLCNPCNSGKQARHTTDYRDIKRGHLVGIMFGQKMILSRPEVIHLEPADLLRG